jgi:hypothetical protein
MFRVHSVLLSILILRRILNAYGPVNHYHEYLIAFASVEIFFSAP